MLLYTCGCSFTYGEELCYPHIDSWPNILGRMLNLNNINTAKTGASQCYIFRKTINDIYKHKTKKLFVIIGWTGINRIEGYDNRCVSLLHNTNNIFQYVNNPSDLEFFYKNSLHYFLNKYNIKHIFFDVFLKKYKTFDYHITEYNMYQYSILKKCNRVQSTSIRGRT